MPKLFEYLGLILFFYSNEHEPIHCHAVCGEFESKVEFLIENGEIVEIIIKNVKGRKPIEGKDLQNLKELLEYKANEVVVKWIDYFIYHKKINFERITKKLK